MSRSQFMEGVMRRCGFLMIASVVTVVTLSAPSVAAPKNGAGNDQPIDTVLVNGIQAGQTFEPLTFWQQVRLGATGLVKPDVARDASFAYAYGPDAIKLGDWVSGYTIGVKQDGKYKTLDSEGSAKIVDAIKSGHVDAAGKADIKLFSSDPLPADKTAASGELMIGWPH